VNRHCGTPDENVGKLKCTTGRKFVVPVLWSVASGWAGSFVTTTETPRELVTKSRSIAIRLWLGGPAEPSRMRCC